MSPSPILTLIHLLHPQRPNVSPLLWPPALTSLQRGHRQSSRRDQCCIHHRQSVAQLLHLLLVRRRRSSRTASWFVRYTCHHRRLGQVEKSMSTSGHKYAFSIPRNRVRYAPINRHLCPNVDYLPHRLSRQPDWGVRHHPDHPPAPPAAFHRPRWPMSCETSKLALRPGERAQASSRVFPLICGQWWIHRARPSFDCLPDESDQSIHRLAGLNRFRCPSTVPVIAVSENTLPFFGNIFLPLRT